MDRQLRSLDILVTDSLSTRVGSHNSLFFEFVSFRVFRTGVSFCLFLLSVSNEKEEKKKNKGLTDKTICNKYIDIKETILEKPSKLQKRKEKFLASLFQITAENHRFVGKLRKKKKEDHLMISTVINKKKRQTLEITFFILMLYISQIKRVFVVFGKPYFPSKRTIVLCFFVFCFFPGISSFRVVFLTDFQLITIKRSLTSKYVFSLPSICF